jgi:hypothetical protein
MSKGMCSVSIEWNPSFKLSPRFLHLKVYAKTKPYDLKFENQSPTLTHMSYQKIFNVQTMTIGFLK